ncbi:hypothetical protein EST38_g2777 [Candolleomyces aberdarensis]|uniref:Uncharacterized protein n=1 Tax=Candolleomyces aberdarensis TaxID=2316362 RepID=A0A4Q2DSP5_9AGAR|nr:hypothetical protein EST38_g2777 [Candolleomyces aberdarensis]
MLAPQLVKLSMTVEAGESILQPTTPSPYSHDVISSLRCLDISTNDIDAAIIALQCLPERNELQSFACTLFDGDESSSAAHRIFDLIASKCKPHTFSELLLKGCMAARQEDRDDYVDISALFPMSGLKHVEIFLPSTIMELTPAQVETIPAAWPQIEELVLNAGSWGSIWTARPRIDHTHLTTVLRGCSNLRVLGTRFDATQIGREQYNQSPAEEEEEEDVEWQCGLEEFLVSDSPILSSSQMAAFLTSHVPRLRKLYCFHPYLARANAEFFTEYEQHWNDVASDLSVSSTYADFA